jgi:LysR family nitrogen assimilation transcriptional regulator
MDFKQIEYFIAVAERRSFSRAAEALNVSQPALSRQVGLLEADLGQHLLYRNGRGVEPTEAGLRFIEHAQGLLALAQRAREDLRSMRDTPSGKVVIGLPPRVALVLTPLLVATFRQALPAASIAIAEGLSTQVREWLLTGRVDLALLYDPPPAPQLAYESLFGEDLVLAAAPSSIYRLPRQVRIEHLARYPLIMPSHPHALRSLVTRVCRAQGVQLDVVAEVDAVHTIVELASQGHACAVLPRSAVQGPHAERRFDVAALVAPRVTNDLVLALPRQRHATRLADATANLVRGLDLAPLFATGTPAPQKARKKTQA